MKKFKNKKHVLIHRILLLQLKSIFLFIFRVLVDGCHKHIIFCISRLHFIVILVRIPVYRRSGPFPQIHQKVIIECVDGKT